MMSGANFEDPYGLIEANAPNHSSPAAGELHEDLWFQLLRHTVPDLRNVRVTRGDGSIDGIHFLDPRLGTARVFQAKFYRQLIKADDAKGSARHQREVVDSLIGACSHTFECKRFTLLVPFRLSHTELNWLSSDLRAAAVAEASASSPVDADLVDRLGRVEIDYKDRDELERLMVRYITTTCRLLPHSRATLILELRAAKDHASFLAHEIRDFLAVLTDEAVRNREVETRRIAAAMKVLNQGWADHSHSIENSLRTCDWTELERCARDLAEFAATKMADAFACEGRLPGISEVVSQIHLRARGLIQAAVFRQEHAEDSELVGTLAKELSDHIRTINRRVGEEFLREYSQRSRKK